MAIVNWRTNEGFEASAFNITDARPGLCRARADCNGRVVYQNSLGQILAEVDVSSQYSATIQISDTSIDGSTGSFTAQALDASGSLLEAATTTYRVGTFAIELPTPGSTITRAGQGFLSVVAFVPYPATDEVRFRVYVGDALRVDTRVDARTVSSGFVFDTLGWSAIPAGATQMRIVADAIG
jgi:hypothetical protein